MIMTIEEIGVGLKLLTELTLKTELKRIEWIRIRKPDLSIEREGKPGLVAEVAINGNRENEAEADLDPKVNIKKEVKNEKVDQKARKSTDRK